jgi:hypothetical protein
MTALVYVVLAAGAGTPFIGEPARGLAFDTLVDDIKRLHVFTPRTSENLGRKWEDELPALRKEALKADTAPKLAVAFTHLANALHNPHVSYSPPQRLTSVTNGVKLETEWSEGRVRFYVAKPVGGLNAGDILLSADGEDGAQLLERHANESNMNQWRGIARGVARWLTTRAVMPEGGKSVWVVQDRNSGGPRTVEIGWTGDLPGGGATEQKLDYEGDTCAGLPDRGYGKIIARGQNLCVYAGKPGYPVVRHFSFNYGGGSLDAMQHSVRAEHENLVRALGTLGNLKGLIVDLRDNSGGNNPNWILDWYAPAPYVDRFVRVKLPAAKDEAKVLQLLGNGRWVTGYRAALKARQPGDDFAPPRTFFCKDDDCAWDNRYEPAHPVTKAPVALLVGPGCVSSCDSVAFTFKENDFGPLIGEPTASAYTTQRLTWPVTLQSGQAFGSIALAFSDEVSGKTHLSIESVPLEPTKLIEPTFETAATYDGLLVDAAIADLEARKKAKK